MDILVSVGIFLGVFIIYFIGIVVGVRIERNWQNKVKMVKPLKGG